MRSVMQSGRSRRAGGFFGGAAALMMFIGAGCVEQDDDKPTDEDMKAVKANILTAATPQFAVNADLEGKVVYLGMDADPSPAQPGKELKLTHYWKMVASPGDGWRVFTHIEGPNHQNFINADHGPVGGKYGVNRWKPGEIIRDQQTITLPPTWTHESVMVYVGLWRGPTRLAVKSGANDGANRVIAATIPVKGAPKPENARKRYVARRVSKPVKIDGKLDEQAWQDAASTGPFVNTLSGGPVEQKTEAKLLWDDKFLYVAFDNADTDIWANLTKRDDKLWTQEADELMIDADSNGKTYVEIQVAPNGNVFDSYLPQYRKYEDTIDSKKQPYSWNSKINVKVDVQGSLNKHDDKDKGWTVELALPLGDVKGMEPKTETPRLPPTIGDVWRINMFRMDVPQGKGQQASGWSPPLVGDFHALDRFGELVFGDEKGNAVAPSTLAVATGDKGDKKVDKPGDKKVDTKGDKVGKGEKGSQKSGDKDGERHAGRGKHKAEDKATEKVEK